ncbi:MAG: GerMN domain-containing protein [Actinomycetota bacterium]
MRLAAVLTVAAILAGACRSEGLTLLSEADLPEDVYGSPGPTPEETPEIPDVGTVYLVRGERLVARPNTSLQFQPADSLAEALMLALITAPGDRRITNAIPERTRLNEVRIDGPVATVDLSSEFEGAAPSEQQTLRIAQVVYTLTQEGTDISSVRISIDGVLQQLTPALLVTRGDYRGVAPPNEGQR